MKKWTALSPQDETYRWQALSDSIREKGVANEFVPWEHGIQEFSDFKMFDQFDHVRMSSSIAVRVLKHVKVQSSWTTLLGVVDGMNKTPHGWWPLCALYENFGQMLIELGQDLDMRGSVMVAGAGASARVVVASFFKAGFQEFLITNFDDQEAQKMIADMRSRFFGMKMEWVPMEKIVLLPGNCSVLVNCTPSIEENALLTELSYLNFLKRPGILFDLGRGSRTSVLAEEVRDAGVRAITGLEIAARTDVLWAKWGFGTDIELAPYQEKLNKNFT